MFTYLGQGPHQTSPGARRLSETGICMEVRVQKGHAHISQAGCGDNEHQAIRHAVECVTKTDLSDLLSVGTVDSFAQLCVETANAQLKAKREVLQSA